MSNFPPNKRMQMDCPKRYALVSATDAKRYVADVGELDRARPASERNRCDSMGLGESQKRFHTDPLLHQQ